MLGLDSSSSSSSSSSDSSILDTTNAPHMDPNAATSITVVTLDMGALQTILKMPELDAAALETQHPTFVFTGKFLT
jgi:hypothetical protein